MAEISAAQVKQLRDRTGQAMMDCKKALVEAGGDLEKAIDLLRKKGMVVLEKRSGRETNEGTLMGKLSPDGRSGVLTMLTCETDFTARSDDFQAAATTLADAMLTASNPPDSVEGVKNLEVAGGRKMGEIANDIIGKTGEKVEIGRFARFDLEGPALLHCYVHFNGKVGAMVQIGAENEDAANHEATKTLAADVAMHITAANPTALSREDMDPQEVEREKDVAKSQVKNKPDHIVDKIIVGKMNKWYQQVVLLEQPFVKDDSKSVGQLLEETSKLVGGKLILKRFIRTQIG